MPTIEELIAKLYELKTFDKEETSGWGGTDCRMVEQSNTLGDAVLNNYNGSIWGDWVRVDDLVAILRDL